MSRHKFKFHCNSDHGQFEAVVWLDFMPQIGMQVAIFHGDNFRKVDDVYWHVRDGFEVFLADEENPRKGFMESFGWVDSEK